MTVKESRLSIVIDSMSAQQQIDGLRARLKTLEEAGLSVSQSMNSAGSSTGNAGQKAQSASVEMNKLVAEMRANAAATAELTKNVLGMNNSIDKLATNTLRESQRQTKMYTDAINSLNKSSRTTSVTTANANDSLENQSEVFNRLVNQIDPVIARLDKLDQQEEQLRVHFKNGIVDTETFDTLKAKIDQSRESLGRFGNTSRSVASAERTLARETEMVAPQLTDIFTSLIGGEPAYLVAIQQGGQLRDMFGSIGEAGTATARVIGSMVNPYTLVAAAIGGLAVAAYKGANEMDGLNKAIISTGQGGIGSSDVLSGMADNIAKISGVTRGDAISALTQVVQTGKFAQNQYQQIAQAAEEYSRASGQSIQDIVSQYASLEGNPVQAIQKLNDQYHFLTTSQFEEIDALQKSGDAMGATQAAMNALEQVHEQRSKEMQQQAGYVERAWEGVAGTVSSVWEKIMGLGRTTPLTQQIASAQANLAATTQEIQRMRSVGYSDNGSSVGIFNPLGAQLRYAEQERQQIENLRRQLNVSTGYDAFTQNQKALNDININAINTWDKLSESTKTYAQRVADVTKQTREQIELARNAGKSISAAQERNAINAAVGKVPGAPHHTRSSHSAVNQQIEQMMRERQTISSLITPYNALDVAQAKYQGQLADISRAVKDGSSNEIEATVARVNAAASYQKVADSIHSTSDRLKEYQATLDAQRTTQQQQNMLQVAGVGMGSQEFQRAQQLLQTQQQFQQQVTQLEQQRSQTHNLDQQNYITGEIAAQRKMMELTLGDQQDMYKQLDAMQGNWKNGASSAWQDYLDQAKNTADMTKSLFSNAFSSATNDLANFVATGKLNLADFSREIVSDFAKVAIQRSVLGLTNLFGGSSGGESISSGAFKGISDVVGHSVGFSAGGYTGHGSKYQPAGVVHAEEYVIRSEVTRQPGMRNYLDNLNRGYANGGYVSPRTYSSAQSAQPSDNSKNGDVHVHYSPVLHVDARGAHDPQAVQQASYNGAKLAYQQIQQDIRSNGPILQSIRRGIK
ncbi:hypothetical protein LMG33818_000877 [Halomonadaceae bacterium LMG 33818]|uniref:phage tail tape measure protein n=1 Tax=Cernens ardua TaxID=3402176 RepID=UPI003EDBE531